ncbi:MAG TPA: hypothetical protein PKW18_04390 [Candidatus Sumerlaeota bacterium]|nr:MAG: hypothetical protein BWY12_01394 [candidate division BRC1 bacterium ADurb.Bin183]HOE64513.1 hypothetical protein [Candidatus Sumerlaeota bacterium]HRR30060.1 hypothetical protein [Candidatus Sumerlaeia bacterium]HON51258.1 hypothetical protein [Candidatus Sumerlaeota bacterium]HOR64425.1 hypothetical protein [Candidatus Sumerlaeota bacterium]
MPKIRFYINPSHLKLFSVRPESNIRELWDKRNSYLGGLTLEQFQQKNPNACAEISAAWNLLANPCARPYLILGVRKEISIDELKTVYAKMIADFPLPSYPECNRRLSEAYAILSDPVQRVFVDFFTFDDPVWNLWFLESDSEIEVRREIEKQFSGSTFKQIINSTLFCFYKASQIEESGGNFEDAVSYWKKAYLGWQGILHEGFIWEELRNHVERGGIYPLEIARRFDDIAIEDIKSRLISYLVENALERCKLALKVSLNTALEHLRFLKYIKIEDPHLRSQIALMYNQCAFILAGESRLVESVRLLEEALAIDPNLPVAKTNLDLARTATSGVGQALRLVSINQWDEAYELLRNKLNENPDDADASELLVEILHKQAHEAYRMGDVEETFRRLSEACNRSDAYLDELKLVQRLKQEQSLDAVLRLIESQDYASAAKILKEYITIFPEQTVPKKLYVRLLNQIALQKNRQRLWLEARDILKEAHSIEPSNGVISSNLTQLEKASENQQTALLISQAMEAVNQGKPQDAINLIQPIYTTADLPTSVREELRHILAFAYLAHGHIMAKQAESAVSRGAIKEALEAAHLSFTIADFMDSTEDSQQNLSMLEDALPELAQKEYDQSQFPLPPGGQTDKSVPKKRRFKARKRKGVSGSPLTFAVQAQTAPRLIPISFIIILIMGYIIGVILLGAGMLKIILFSALLQGASSLLAYSSQLPQRRMPLIGASAACLILAAASLFMISSQPKGKKPARQTARIKPAQTTQTPPQPTIAEKTPPPTPYPTITPFPVAPKGPGMFRPFFSKTRLDAKKLASIYKPAPTPAPTPAKTPPPALTPPPSRVGKVVEVRIIIQDFISIRQEPRPIFIYRIKTPEGMASLLIDPLVYIKLPKEIFGANDYVKAKARIIQEGTASVYALESPSDILKE